MQRQDKKQRDLAWQQEREYKNSLFSPPSQEATKEVLRTARAHFPFTHGMSVPVAKTTSGKSYKQRLYLWEKQKGICAYCDTILETPNHGTRDHIISRYKGGKDVLSNYALVCPPCNALKAWFTSVAEVEEFTNRLTTFFKRLQERGYVQ